MTSDVFLACAAGALFAFLVSWFLAKRRIGEHVGKLQVQEESNRSLERQVYVQERDFLEQRNRIEVLHSDAIKAARAAAFEEGRQLGNAERQRDHVTELTTQRSEFASRLQTEREQAGVEARERLRSEYELQTKLFTVQISPYVRIADVKEYFKKKYDVQTGYQYQLLVNGIPAFQPHLIIESDERKEAVDEENVKELAAFAVKAAEAAVQTYLGGGGQFVKMAALRVLRVAANSAKARLK